MIPVCPDERGGDTRDVQRHHAHRVGACRSHPRLVGERSGRDATVHAAGQQPREDLYEISRVLDPRVVLPVGSVHVGLDGRVVERAVRKAVDQSDVQTGRLEVGVQLVEVFAGEQLARLLRGEPQAQPERSGGREPAFERRSVPA